ncbi:MAG TPA: tRNA (adenosine(37)-N6)-threonylcarbamoyltransferase complex dimerization subunit type 1 TsaB [Methylomirabilota bacterium]|jgi:tRNA threonylcarbamoyladenosine biosynthesis protein TsaB|nr:tRNA (adenosine(37)-N6)-threonylcarbamoyltransferase complex dimerization subunit type 1 TsaB [Methylomirabilota bacterium]
MRLLALETATLAGGAALLDDGRLVGESRLNIALTHSERLMAVVDRLLQDCGWEMSTLRGLAVSIGPGSFTGLRVGAATAKGLALALDLPIAPVPTLDALAATLPFADAPVCPLLDARKGEIYCSLYRWSGAEMIRVWDYLALPPAEAAARLVAPVIVVGDGVAACRPHMARLGAGLREAPPAQSLPSPAVVGALGHAMLRAGGGVPAERLQPLYLRPSEAELKIRHA